MRLCGPISVVCILASVAFGEPGAALEDAARRFCAPYPVRRPASSQVPSGGLIPGPSISGFDHGEFLLDTNIVWVPAEGRQIGPAIAFDDTNFLVVWADERSGCSWDIYCVRVSQTGAVLDPGGIAISSAPGSQLDPAVAFDGTNYLVVWTDSRNGSYCDVYGARVTPTGGVLDPGGIAISTEANSQYVPAVAFDGTDYLVVWSDERAGRHSFDTYGCRVATTGVVLEPSGIPISTAANGQHDPSLAFDGADFLVVWSDYRNHPDTTDIYGARVTPAGVVLDTAGISICTAADGQGFSATAFDGTNCFVAWTDWRASHNRDIYGCRVSPDGTVLDPSGIAVATGSSDQATPAVSFDGVNLLVAWEDLWNISGARVSPAGQVLDTSAIAISTAIYQELHPAVASDGSRSLVAWGDFIDSGGWASDVVGTRVTQDGVVLEPDGILISIATNWQRQAAIAFDSTNYLVAWADWRGEYDSDIHAARVSQAGTVLDSTSIVVSTEDQGQRPAVAFDGTNYLVVWERWHTFSDIRACRVSPTGQVLDTLGIVISTQIEQFNPAVAFDGSNYLVVWTTPGGTAEAGIYGARVSPGGQVLDTACFVLWNGRCGSEEPAVAFDGTNFLVVCTDTRELSNVEIYGGRVTPAGEVLDPEGTRISAATGYPWSPAVAFDGTNFLVVWYDWRTGDLADIHGARVSQAGTVLDPSGIAISTAVNEQLHPVLAFDGSDFLVVWDDSRNSPDSADIYGVRVGSDGTVFAEGPVVMQEGRQSCPALARGTGNQLFLVYQGWTGTVGSKAYNTDRIWGKMNPVPGVEEIKNEEVSREKARARVVRDMLWVEPASSFKPQASGLLDISGRKVMDVKPGLNDIRHIAPGIYFLRPAESGQRSAVRKVIVTR